MKTSIPKLIVVSSLVTIAAIVAVPAVNAAEEKTDAAARKAQREAEMVKKYDANQDGKLDDVERAARKLDREKAKAERDAKKRDRAERKPDSDEK
ncbi:MAG: hypothetical protein JWM32_2329 [Verrucomicrobia bacterium]|nr:hypothetical protein [Verrucomicrobiota bacterium]